VLVKGGACWKRKQRGLMETVITLHKPELVKKLQQFAQAHNCEAADFLDMAVGEYLDKMAREKITAEREALDAHYADILAAYNGQYVAVHQGRVVDSDSDARALYLRIRARYGYIPVLIRRITPQPRRRELVFRSPRLSQGAP
jgi:hypothetical protein